MESFKLSDEDIDSVTRIAHHAKRRWPWRDYGDLEHDALWGLFVAWKNFGDRTDWTAWKEANIWWEIKRGLRKTINREQIAQFENLDEPIRNRDKSQFLHDVLPDKEVLEDIVLNSLDLDHLLLALKNERPVVQEAVLRSDNDEAIAKKHNLRDGNSIRQYRNRFLRDYMKFVMEGGEYKSTGRNSKPRKGLQPAPDGIEYDILKRRPK